MVARRIPDRSLRRAIEKIERQRRPERVERKRFPDIEIERLEKTGALVGVGAARRLVEKYIKILERSWGGPPTEPQDMAVACQWIEESALGEAFEKPAWDSIVLTVQYYSLQTAEGQAADLRIWRAYEEALVLTVRNLLTKYGCGKLRFADMPAFVRYYRGG